MDSDLAQQLAAYDRAVFLAGDTYKGMSFDERGIRTLAGKELAKHAPSDRSDPTCPACEGASWPCESVKGAIVLADPLHN
ncbi:hypothetical protein ACIA8O_38980 [Kitasatospora sp. NPDC051853]|uniref:hypothetical protein n=1 Tax=Kitasatospora sp. NPDC051853 TaxID=3364058 RepID=UPI00378BC0D3